MKNKILSNKGITLIALVITIIVLLILVGIVIAALTGENGILSRATEARAANALGEAKDKCALIAADATEEYYKATYVSNNSNLSAIAQSSRCVGSIPNNPSARNTATYSHISGTNDYFASYDGQFEAGEEDATYIANNTTNYTVDKAQLDRLSIATITDTTNGSNYWLASRFLNANSSATMFLVHVVDSSGGLNQRGTCNVYSNGGQPTYSCTMRIVPSHNSKV